MKKKLLSLLAILLFTFPLLANDQNLGPILGKIIKYSGKKGVQAPEFIIDGKSSTTNPKAGENEKWCVENLSGGALNPQWVVIDLGVECDINKFIIHDGPSIEGLNQWVQPFGDYIIYASTTFDEDKGINGNFGMTPVFARQAFNSEDEKLVRTDIPQEIPAKARYILLKIMGEKVIRLFEFEIWGKAGSSLLIDPVEPQKIINNNNPTVDVSYKISGAKGSDFKYEVTSKSGEVKINNKKDEGNKISFQISSDADFASDEISVEITHNGKSLSRTFAVKVANSNPTRFVNIAKNKKAYVAYSETTTDENGKTIVNWKKEEASAITDGDINTNFENNPAQHDNELRVVLDDAYIISAVRYIYNPTQLDSDKKLETAGLYISEKNLGDTWHAPKDLKYSNESFPGTAINAKADEFAVLSTPTEAFSIDIKNNFDNIGSTRETVRKMAIYETMVYCELPVLENATNTTCTETTPITFPIDLKGFNKIKKENIKIEVISEDKKVKASEITINESRDEISFLLKSTEAKDVNLEVKVSNLNGEFNVSKEITAKPMIVEADDNDNDDDDTGETPSSLKNTLNDVEVKVWPSLITNGNLLNIDAPTAQYVRIISLLGKNVLDKKELSGAHTQLETSSFAPGVYLVQLLNKQGGLVKTTKIVVK